MAAIFNFEKFFIFFFQKAQQDPRKVIVWKFQGPRLNGLGATDGTDKQTDKQSHNMNTRRNPYSQLTTVELS